MTNELLDAVDDLTLPKPVKVPTDDGYTWAREDALLVQLQEAIISSIGGTAGGRTSPWTRNVLDSAALHQATIITSTIGDWCRIANVKPTRDAVTDLRAWYVAMLATPDRDDQFYIRQMHAWARQIREMIVPPHRPIELVGAVCPEVETNVALNDVGEVAPHQIRGWIENNQPIIRCTCGREWVGWNEARALRYDMEMAEEA